MYTIKKIQLIFNQKTKIQFLILLVAIIFGAFVEMLAIAAVAPFIAILLDNTLIETNQYINRIYVMFNPGSVNAFMTILALALAGMYVFRGLYIFFIFLIMFIFIYQYTGVFIIFLV